MKYIFINIWRVLVRELKMMFARPLYLFASVGVMLLSTFFFLTLMKKNWMIPSNVRSGMTVMRICAQTGIAVGSIVVYF